MFSFRVKELFETIVLREEKAIVFSLFKSISWETDLWVTLGDFYGKKPKIRKRNLYTENQLSRNVMWSAADKHS